MGKLRSVFIAVLTLLYLAGCSTSSPDMPYDVIQENGNYYLIMKDTWTDTSNETTSSITVSPSIKFGSVKEMKHDIENGNFTKQELKQLVQFSKDGSGQIKICNLDNLYTAQFPATLDSYRVSWSGEHYSFYIPNQGISLDISSKEFFDREMDRRINFESDTPYRILTKTYESDRNATVYTYNDHYIHEQCKNMYYTISEKNKTIYVEEQYIPASDSAPYFISILGVDNGIYFSVTCIDVQERPSVDWLSQFGVQKYIENSIP